MKQQPQAAEQAKSVQISQIVAGCVAARLDVP